jgi:hypothetical protein
VKSRRKLDASGVILDTPENRALVAEAGRLRKIAREAEEAAKAFEAAIPRIDVNTLAQAEEE